MEQLTEIYRLFVNGYIPDNIGIWSSATQNERNKVVGDYSPENIKLERIRKFLETSNGLKKFKSALYLLYSMSWYVMFRDSEDSFVEFTDSTFGKSTEILVNLVKRSLIKSNAEYNTMKRTRDLFFDNMGQLTMGKVIDEFNRIYSTFLSGDGKFYFVGIYAVIRPEIKYKHIIVETETDFITKELYDIDKYRAVQVRQNGRYMQSFAIFVQQKFYVGDTEPMVITSEELNKIKYTITN